MSGETWRVDTDRQFVFGMDKNTRQYVKDMVAARELDELMDGHTYFYNAELGPMLTRMMLGKSGEDER